MRLGGWHKSTNTFTFKLNPYNPPVCAQKVQMEKTESTAPLLEKKENKKVRQVVGKVIFYGRIIYNNILMDLNTIATHQDNTTDRT